MADLRERKKAAMKVALVKFFLAKLTSNRYDLVRVIDLCKEAGISKVTFFNYFDSKEELLRYSFRIWCMEISYELNREGAKGIQGLLHLLDHIAIRFKEMPYFFYSYYSYQIIDSRIRAPFTIKSEERKLLGPNYNDTEIHSLIQLIDSFVLDAVFKGEIKASDPKAISGLIYTYLVGMITEAGMQNAVIDKIVFRQKIDFILSKYR